MWVVSLLLASLLSTHCSGQDGGVFVTPDIDNKECIGSVMFYHSDNGHKTTVLREDAEMDITIDAVKIEGCGCFIIYNKKEGRGKSYYLGLHGQNVSAAEIGWARVRSVRSRECSSLAMPIWGVVLIVVGVMLMVGILAVIGFKKYRQANSL